MSRLSRLLRRALHPVLILGTGAAWAQASPPPQSPPRQQATQRDEASQRDFARQRDQERRERGREQAQRELDSQRGGLPASVRRVERQTGGEVLRAEPMQRDGREVYRLKVLTADGRVRVVQDDPDRPRSEEASEERPAGRKGRQQEQTSRDSDEDPPQ